MAQVSQLRILAFILSEPRTLGEFPFFWPHCAACGVLLPQPGIEPMPPAVEAQWNL